VTETPPPSSQHGVGRCRHGTEPAICDPSARWVRGGDAWIFRDPRPRPAPTSVVHVDLGGAPTIFSGSQEPGAGCLLPTEQPHRHVSPTRDPKPPPLCSPRITADPCSYGWLRLPTASARFLAFDACSRVRRSFGADCRISLVTALSRCEARHGLRLRGVAAHSPWCRQRCCLLAHLNHRPLPTSVFSELYAFKVSITCYPCTSPPLLTTHQSVRYRSNCKSRFQVRG
jgi:hypothetical protein